jgi:hypothetical protein
MQPNQPVLFKAPVDLLSPMRKVYSPGREKYRPANEIMRNAGAGDIIGEIMIDSCSFGELQ